MMPMQLLQRVLFVVSIVGLTAIITTGCSHEAPKAASETKAAAEPRVVPVTVTVVTERAIQRTIEVVGTFHGMEEVTVSSKAAGRITKILHDVGDTVKAGDELLEIDDIDYRLAVEEAARSLESELAKLGLAKLPSGQVNIDELPSVIRNQALTENAKRKYQRADSLRAKNINSQDEFEQTQTDYQVAEMNLEQARMDARSTIAAARHRNASLTMMAQKLRDTKVTVPAPSNSEAASFVVSERLVSEGEMVQGAPPTELFKLVVDNVLKLKVTVPERHIGDLSVGQTAAIAVDAYPRETFEGRVSRINPTIDPASRTCEIEVLVQNNDRKLRPGNFAKIAVLTSQDTQAITVPEETLVSFAGVQKIFVVRKGKAVAVEVKVGMRGDHWLEVVGDVQPGDQVVTTGYTQLADGTAVRVRTAETTRIK
jgi:RND family efflux transporter MFP subunit